MKTSSISRARKATWIAFGLIALAVVASGNEEPPNTDVETKVQIDVPTTEVEFTESTLKDKIGASDQNAEASRAFRQAMFTLQNITGDVPEHVFDPSSAYATYSSKSLFSSFMPNLDGQGPIGSALRIAAKLQQNSIVRRMWSGVRPTGSARQRRKDADSLKKAVKVLDLLHHSAELGNLDALYALAQVSLFPPSEHFPSDPRLAFDSLTSHASITGNASSQALLAFFYSTGYHGIVPVNQGRAQLYYTFAANGGHKGAQMALGYRYWAGIGTAESCESAMGWYEDASEQSMARFLSGPIGGRTLPLTGTRLSDLVGGVYGSGSSVASTGFNTFRASIKAGAARASGERWDDILDYYIFSANRGEFDHAYRLGKIYYHGSIYHAAGGISSGGEGVGAVPQDYKLALHYFLRVAQQLWPQIPNDPTKDKPSQIKEENGQARWGVYSAGYIGRMYLRGEGVKVDYTLAKMWFDRGAEFGDRESQNGLGILLRDGLIPGRKPEKKKAREYFLAAAQDHHAEAQVNLAKLHFERREFAQAATWFESAISVGSPFEAYYYLGAIHAGQAEKPGSVAPSVSGSCAMAVSFHKLVSERGSWEDDLLRDAEVAWTSGTDQGREMAVLKWWIAAERGQEVAQNNLAFIFDQDRSILRLTRFSPMIPSNDTAQLALTQWTRASGQRNVDALVKVADYYFYGLGVADEPGTVRFEKAARYYQSAADTGLSALAMWNLGWMYENGIGVTQDFHLAKRNYDLALATNSEAYLPVFLSLTKLYARSIWHTLRGGKGGLNIWDLEEDEEILRGKAHQGREIGLGRSEMKASDKGPAQEDESRHFEDDDSPWYFGKARDDFRRRRNQDRRAEEDNDDPVAWARERRMQEQEREGDFGPEDYFDASLRGDREGDSDDFVETMILVFICIVVSVLIYVRTRIVDGLRREEQRQQEQQRQEGQAGRNDGGVFPPPGDPARHEWNILR